MNSPALVLPREALVVPKGPCLIEAELPGPVSDERFLQGVSKRFQQVVLDESVRRPSRADRIHLVEPSDDPEWGDPFTEKTPTLKLQPAGSRTRFRFIAVAPRAYELADQGSGLRWIFSVPIGLDPYAPLKYQEAYHPLETDRVHELRLLSRMKNAATRKSTTELLEGMGFKILKLALLKRNMRLPGREGADYALWYAVAVWTGPNSYTTGADSFLFEDVRPI